MLAGQCLDMLHVNVCIVQRSRQYQLVVRYHGENSANNERKIYIWPIYF